LTDPSFDQLIYLNIRQPHDLKTRLSHSDFIVGGRNMPDTATKLPATTETKGQQNIALQTWHPFETLHREIGRLFEDFDLGRNKWRLPSPMPGLFFM
jgi:hypothetical protein